MIFSCLTQHKYRLRSLLLILPIAVLLEASEAAWALNSIGISHQTIFAIQAKEDAESDTKKGKSFSGNVSWYGLPFHGKKTASGEIFDMNKLTAAHLKLPFGTHVLVEDPRTGKTVIIKVNDRGPYVRTRVMDLSKEGAKRLGTLSRGVAYVDCLIVTD